MRLKRIVSGIACMLYACAVSSAQTKTVLKTEFQDVYPKYFVKDGVPSGISYEIMRLVERNSRFTFEYSGSLVALGRVSNDLSAGVMDIQFGLQKTPERESSMVFGPPLYSVRIVGVMRADDPDSISSIADIVGGKHVVLTQLGTGAAMVLRSIPGLRLDDAAKSVAVNLEKLLIGRGKILLYHNLSVNAVLADPGNAGKFRLVEINVSGYKDLESADQYVVYAKHVPPSTVAEINGVIEALRKSGELGRITEKYLDNIGTK